MKLYDVVKNLLISYPELRNSDRKLIWAVCWKKQLVQVDAKGFKGLSRMLYMNFLQAPAFESITRARRKIQELYPELRSTKQVIKERRKKELTKGTFVYREKL